MSESREKILNRVRDAMRTPAPHPAAPTGAPVFATVTNPEQRFREEFLTLKGEVIDSPEQLRGFLAGFTKIATDGSNLVKQAVGAGNAGVREADLGVTACDCLIAQMGAIVVSPKSAGGRALSVLPPVHLVIAHRNQLLPDLATAIAFIRRRYDGQWPSTLSIITGPSR
ncbi:MAG: LUD domain-containing protein, partial [Verrucomicrobiota bacterium]